MKRCVIIGGADIHNYDRVRSYLRPEDFCIYCDSGLYHQERLCALPTSLSGTFDSHPEARKHGGDHCPAYGKGRYRHGVRREGGAAPGGFEDFLLVGVSGGRMDHTLVNIYLLVMLQNAGKSAVLVDDFSEMRMVGAEPVEIPDSFPYYSLVNITGTARGVTETGCKYPLRDAEITSEYQYGTSNEVLPGQTAAVSVKEGSLLLIKVFPKDA